MKTSLLFKVYRALRKGYRRMTPDAQKAMQAFVASQQTAHGYMNAAGCEDSYYSQFGEVLQAVFHPVRLIHTEISLTVPESRQQDSIYGLFFRFLEREAKGKGLELRVESLELRDEKSWTTNAVCCILSMQHQMGMKPFQSYVEWIQQRQDETGGFRASELAPIPDLLSTAVALFSLRLLDAPRGDASQFIQVHWLDSGGFAPTLLDNYSDVEYVFYGLLALGSL